MTKYCPNRYFQCSTVCRSTSLSPVPTSSLQLSNEFLPKVQAAFEKIYGTVKTRLGENNGQHIASFMQERLVDPLFLGSQKKVSDIENIFYRSLKKRRRRFARTMPRIDRLYRSSARFFFWRFLQKGLKVKRLCGCNESAGANSVGGGRLVIISCTILLMR